MLMYRNWEKAKKTDFILELGKAIAPALESYGGSQWHFIPEKERAGNDYDNQYMHMTFIMRTVKGEDTEYHLSIRVDEYKERLEVSGRYARGKIATNAYYGLNTYSGDKPENITVSLAREGKEIANDINRRCLPVYFTNMRKSIERRDAWDKTMTTQQEIRDRINEAVGDKQGRDNVYMYWRNGEAIIKIEARVNSSQSIDLKLDGMTEADTMQIIEIIKANHPQKTKEDQTIHSV